MDCHSEIVVNTSNPIILFQYNIVMFIGVYELIEMNWSAFLDWFRKLSPSIVDHLQTYISGIFRSSQYLPVNACIFVGNANRPTPKILDDSERRVMSHDPTNIHVDRHLSGQTMYYIYTIPMESETVSSQRRQGLSCILLPGRLR